MTNSPQASGLEGASSLPATKPQSGPSVADGGEVRAHPDITEETFAPIWELIRRSPGCNPAVRQSAIKNLRQIQAALIGK